jgi:predicted negative regulator of RcsB-dependent stress response
MTTSSAAATGSTNGILSRSARHPGQLWQVPVFLLGAVALCTVAAASSFVPAAVEDPVEHDLAVVRRALEKPGVPGSDIVTLAERAAGRASREPEKAGEAHFLAGAVYLRLCERSTPERAHEEREKAAMHLELAELRGVPPPDQARLTYLRGKLAYLSGGNMPRAIELLTQSLPGGADNPGEGFAMLVQAQLHKPVPDLEGALEANLKQLEFCDDETMLTQARLLRGELLLKKEMRGEAIKALEAIGTKAPLAVRLKARYLQSKAAMEEGMWGRAIPWWNELLSHPEAVPGIGKGRMFYNLGVCCMNFEAPAHEKEAIAALREAQLHGGEEAQAAAMRLAQLHINSESNQAAALEYFQDALEKVSGSSDYTNSLLDLRQARALLEDACRIFANRRDAEHFLQAAELYKKIAAPGTAEERIGQAAEARGRELLQEATQGPDGAARKVQAQDAFQKAALAYEQAAETRSPTARIDVLWRCIESYRLAEKPEQAIAVLKKFVELPAPKERKAEAWFTLAQMQRLLKMPDARESYKQCVAFNADAFTSQARLQLADIAIELQELDQAEAVLQQVKSPANGPVVDRASHELALLKLASLYFQQRKFDKAALECQDLINQYPGRASLFGVRDQLGECYRSLALQAEESSKDLDVPPRLKNYHQQQRQKSYEAALITYQQLADDLDAKLAAAKALSPAEETLRRRALFRVAECYFKLPNSFEQSFARYNMLFEQFRGDPDALEACRGIYQCWDAALSGHHRDLASFQEAAAASVEYCSQHLDEFDRARAFRTPEDKASWRSWLDTCYGLLKRKTADQGG